VAVADVGTIVADLSPGWRTSTSRPRRACRVEQEAGERLQDEQAEDATTANNSTFFEHRRHRDHSFVSSVEGSSSISRGRLIPPADPGSSGSTGHDCRSRRKKDHSAGEPMRPIVPSSARRLSARDQAPAGASCGTRGRLLFAMDATASREPPGTTPAPSRRDVRGGRHLGAWTCGSPSTAASTSSGQPLDLGRTRARAPDEFGALPGRAHPDCPACCVMPASSAREPIDAWSSSAICWRRTVDQSDTRRASSVCSAAGIRVSGSDPHRLAALSADRQADARRLFDSSTATAPPPYPAQAPARPVAAYAAGGRDALLNTARKRAARRRC